MAQSAPGRRTRGFITTVAILFILGVMSWVAVQIWQGGNGSAAATEGAFFVGGVMGILAAVHFYYSKR